ncbi:MAG: GNAT family N-acetyltransferase [Alphaproteobacteria bacterium]
MTQLLEAIVSDRLRLRPIGRRDTPVFAALGQDPLVFRYIPEIDYPFDAGSWIGELLGNPECYIRHAVERRDSGEVIGAIQLNRRSNMLLQVGYWYGRAHWGHGYATETLEALLAFLDERTREPIHAAVHPDNAASRSVLENNGFICLNRWLSDMMEYRRQR